MSELEEDGVAPEIRSGGSEGRVRWESLEIREEEAEESPLCCGCNLVVPREAMCLPGLASLFSFHKAHSFGMEA